MMQTPRLLAILFPLVAAAAAPAQTDRAQPVPAPAANAVAAGGARPADVTFSEHIAPIVFHNCTSCHRPGEGAPFPLENYGQVRRKARMIAKVTRKRFMPPWLPVPGHGSFEGELRLTDKQIALIQKWVDGGTKQGDPQKLPPMPEFTKGWQLGEPDLIVRMPEGFPVPAGGPDIYRNFVVPTNLTEDKWVTAIEVRPGTRTVLHHIIFGIDTTGRARREDGRDGQPGYSGMRGGANGRRVGTSTSGLGGWAVGGQPRHLPMGLARKLPKGSDLILRTHFHPAGKKEVEQTTLGLYFTVEPPTRTMIGLQLPPMFGVAAGLDVPAGQSDFKLKDSFTLTADAQALTVGGHAHYICTEMQVFATFPGQTKRESIFWIDHWAFNWQNRYQFKKPLDLPKGTKIDVEITYDNSANNPSNPNDPPKRIRWGRQSTDEMGSVTLLLVAKRERDQRKLRRDIRAAGRRSARRNFRNRGTLEGLLVSRVRMMDKNGDGKVGRSEVSARYRHLVDRYDEDTDGALDAKEIEALAKGEVGGFRRRR